MIRLENENGVLKSFIPYYMMNDFDIEIVKKNRRYSRSTDEGIFLEIPEKEFVF